MPPTSNTQTPPPGPHNGTGLVDRVNLGIHVRRYLKIVARRWWMFALCLLAGAGWMAYKAYTAPDMFRSVTIISVAPRLRTTYATQVDYQEALDNFYDENLNLIRGIVKDRADARITRENPLAIGHVRFVDANKLASSFRLTVDGADQAVAKNYLVVWAREFIAYKNEVKDNTVAREAARTADEITRFTHKLEDARAQKEAFLRTNKIGSPTETGKAATVRYEVAIDELRKVQTTLKLEQQRSPKDIADGATTVARSIPGASDNKNASSDNEDPLARFASDSKYSELKLRLLAEQSEMERLRAVLKTNHPYMRLLSTRMAQVQEGMEHQLDLIREKREARIRSLEQQETSLTAQVADLLKDVQGKASLQYEYERLVKDEDSLEKHLDNLQKQMLAFDKSSIDESQFTIVQEAVAQPSPLSPNRQKMILQGLFFGLVIGIGLVYFLHRLDDRLEVAADIEEALEEPVLGQIPQLETRGLKNKCILITNLDQYSFFAEAIRGVRSAIMLGAQGGKKQVLLISSAVPGDGKTTFTANFAATLALAGHRVLLIDADLRRGNTHNYFRHDRHPGLSEMLAGEANWNDVVKSTSIGALQVINSGRLPANPGELLLSPIVKELIIEARSEYDFIVIDCPPLTAIDDAFSLIGFADGLLFVVRAGQTSMRFAKGAIAAARQRGCNILGIVLNGITADNPYYYYNSYYHSYYNRGSDAETGQPLSSALPGLKMAERKARPHPSSIVANARAIAGAPMSDTATEEESKADQYRRLKARKSLETDEM
jgi:succinoglycan biosynthesis transport protein ExoP